MNPPKVFEYAKKIGMETLGLMDKLREWKIPVKSHMAELDEDTLSLIQAKLAEEQQKKTPAKKAKTTKVAKAGKPAAAPKKAAPTKSTKAQKGAAVTPKKSAASKKAAAGGGSRVVLRKAADLTAPPSAPAPAPAPAEIEAPPVEVAEQAAPISAAPLPAPVAPPSAASAPVPAVEAETPSADTPAAMPATTAAPGAAATASATAPTGVSVPPPAAAPTPIADLARPTRSVKREVVIGSGVRSPPTNIVGRIDLNRAREAGRASTRPPPGRSMSTGARGVRTGFVAASAPTQFPVTEDRGRDHHKRKPRVATGEEPAAVREAEQEQFTATEFRKREMIFQPKKKKNILARPSMKTELTTPKAAKRVVKIHDTIKVSELAKEMGVKVSQITTHLMKNGMMVTPNDSLDFDTATLVAPEFGHEIENVAKTSAELIQEVAFGDLGAQAVLRPPVVTVMGHVDHGKTTLLDAIRQADVASGEAGGITQHIGAYKVTLDDGKVVTFIDTPGHEAFTAMRARGANVTDIVVLVVAADDGVMHQTIEAISHAKNAGVPIIVAVNKIDRPNANIQKIKQQLTEYELVAEEWGGGTIFSEVSALKRTGVKELLEQLHAQAEIMELKANPKRSATGIVIESRLERGRGVVATLLIKDGSMKLGQYLCAGATYGRVRALFNDRGQGIKEAGPSDPVEVLGLNSTPRAGDTFDVCPDETAAQALSQKRAEESTVKVDTAPKAKVSLEELFSKVQTGDVKELPIVLKTDVAGSGEALRALLEKASTDKVKIRIIHAGVGGVTESDVLLASSAKGLIIGFNVRPETGAATLAKSQGVEIKAYTIIYEVVDDVKKAMVGLLSPTIVEKTLGHAQVRNVFSIPKIGTIAGCSVVDGMITRSNLVRLLRDSRVIYEGKISSLKRFKDDVREVATGFECGIGIENYNDLKVGDVIEAFEKQSVAGEL